jgi:hypothetical protein
MWKDYIPSKIDIHTPTRVGVLLKLTQGDDESQLLQLE